MLPESELLWGISGGRRSRFSRGGSGQGKPDYELGINRRNKLCRWVEVAGKIEFADSTALVGTRGDRIKWNKKGGIKKGEEKTERKKGDEEELGGKRAEGKSGMDKNLKVSRR